jgi:hypothetical protein
MGDIVDGITILLILLGLSSPIIIIGLIYYLKKRLEHKQIMAAIEKGTPLSDLRPAKPTGPLWIKNLTVGIALLVISLPFLYMFLRPLIRGDHTHEGRLLPFAIFFAIGIAFFIRGLLQRKAQQQIQPSDQSDAGEDK